MTWWWKVLLGPIDWVSPLARRRQRRRNAVAAQADALLSGLDDGGSSPAEWWAREGASP